MQPIIAPVTRASDADTVANLQEILCLFLARGVFQVASDEPRYPHQDWGNECHNRQFGEATANLVGAFQHIHGLDVHLEVDGATAEVMNALLSALDGYEAPTIFEAPDTHETLGFFDEHGVFERPDTLLISDERDILETLEMRDAHGELDTLEAPAIVEMSTGQGGPQWLVRGQVVGSDGPRAEVPVKLYDRDLFFGRPFQLSHQESDGDGGQLLGHTVTGSDGEFQIEFHAANKEGASATTPDLVFAVGEGGQYGPLTVIRLPDGLHLLAEVEISADEALLGIRPRAIETVRVELDGGKDVRLSEYERIWRAMVALLPADDDQNPEARACEAARLLNEETYRDITYLTRQAGLPRELVDRFVESCRLAERFAEAGVSASVLYGLTRAGGFADARALGTASPEELTAALSLACTRGMIPALTHDQQVTSVDAIGRRAPRLALDQPYGSGEFTLGEVLGVAITNNSAHRAELLKLAAEYRGEDLWGLIRDTSLDEYADELRYVIALAALTDGNVPLIKGLISAVPSARTLRALAFRLDDDALVHLVSDFAIPIPAQVPGHDEVQCRAHYAQGLLRLLRNAYPVSAIARMAARIVGTDDAPLSRATATFLTRVALEREDIDMSTLLSAGSSSLIEGSEEQKVEVLEQIRLLRRLYRLSSGEDNLVGLLRSGARSAYDIVRTANERDYVSSYSDQLGGPEQARLTYRRAANITAANLALAVHGRQLSRDLPRAAGDASAAPTWTEIIEGGNGCGECANCQTWLGSAAYLAELMLFLDRRPRASAESTPLEALWKRRPDLARLSLSCTHTETTLPYLDVVIEILESYLATGEGGSSFEDPASHHSSIDALYDRLAEAVYPPTVPFDRWLDTCRLTLERIGLNRERLLATFSGGFGDEEVAKRRERDAETLGLNNREWQIFSRETFAGAPSAVPTHELYGMYGEEFPPAELPGLLERLGITSEEFKALLDCRYINPHREEAFFGDEAQVLVVASEEHHEGSSMRLRRADGSNALESNYRRMALFVRLWRKLGWSMQEVDTALLAAGAVNADGLTPEVLNVLAEVCRLSVTTKADISTLLALWTVPGNDSLTKMIGVPAAEVDAMRVLTDIPTMVDPSGISLLLDIVELARESGLSLEQLRYIYGVEHPGPGALAPRDGEIADLVEELRAGLSAAVIEFPLAAAGDVPPGELITRLGSLLPSGPVVSMSGGRLADDRIMLAMSLIEGRGSVGATELEAIRNEIRERFTSSGAIAERAAVAVFPEPIMLAIPPEQDSAWKSEEQTRRARRRDALTAVTALLRDVRGRSVVTRILADRLEIESGLLRALLGEDPLLSAAPGGAAAMELLLTLGSGDDKRRERKGTYDANTRAYLLALGALLGRIHKTALLVKGMRLTDAELRYLLSHADAFDGFTLPGGMEGADRNGFRAWRRVAKYVALRERLSGAAGSFINVFTAIEGDRVRELARNTGWEPEMLDEAMSVLGIGAADLIDERPIARLDTVISLSRTTGIGSTHLKNWVTGRPDHAQASSILAALPQETRVSTSAAVLLERQRDALIDAALATHILRSEGVRSTTDLYRYFLIDVNTDPRGSTTRAEQAVASVQLFVQRCLLGLEAPAVTARDIDVEQWEWLKDRIRFEDSRRTYLHPENLLLPELRENRSPFFTELEAELSAGDLSAEVVERSVLTYLTKLREVANLEICGFYWQREPGIDVVHVFGRTRTGSPHRYFYRRLIDGAQWTAWESVDVAVQGVERGSNSTDSGVHLLPVVWQGVLYLFWARWTPQRREVHPTVAESVDGVGATMEDYWQVALEWARYEQGSWSSAQTSDAFIECPTDRHAHSGSGHLGWIGVSDHSGVTPRNDAFDLPRRVRLQSSARGRGLRIEFVGTHQYAAMVFDDPTSEPRVVRDGDGGQIPLTLADGDARFQRRRHHGELELVSPLRDMPATRLLAGELDCADVTFSSQSDVDPLNGMFFLQDVGHSYVVTLGEDRAEEWPGLHRVFDFRPSFGTLTGLVDGIGREGSVVSHFALPHMPDTSTWMSPWQAATITLLPEVVDRAVAAVGDVEPRHHESLERRREYASKVYTEIPEALRRVLVGRAALPTVPGRPSVRASFDTFFHPYASEFVHRVHRDGLSGLYSPEASWFMDEPDAFASQYRPVSTRMSGELPRHDVDFTPGGAYSGYNWELFVYIPLLIAIRLSQHQRFAEAQRWFHRIFDPTTGEIPDQGLRSWWIQPLRQPALAGCERLFGDPGPDMADSPAGREALEYLYRAARAPFEPHRLAQLRPVIYRAHLVMAYVDNLLAWGDQLVRQETAASTAQAARLFAFAAELLGPRPASSTVLHTQEQGHSFAALRARWGSAGEVMAETEDRMPFTAPPDDPRVLAAMPALLNLGSGLLFGLPRNEKLLRYWDEVEERLARMRHSAEVPAPAAPDDPVVLSLEPGLLSRASSAGISVTDIVADLSAPLPGHRFRVVHTKAIEMCAHVRAYGAALLSALEQRDDEALALMRAEHERVLVEAVTSIRRWQATQVGISIAALEEERSVTDLEAADIDRRILKGQIRQQLLEADITRYSARIDQAERVERFLAGKYTNVELRGVLSRALSSTYFQAYQLAHDLARQAERCYRFELGIATSGIIPVGYWDDLRTGLLAGERLELALHQLERAYLESDRREFEITRHVSLRQLDPRRLVELRATGRCEFDVPESLFDLDFPGHYFRRIKSVSISVPCVAGPYTAVNGTLTLLGSRLRTVVDADGEYEEQSGDPRFVRDHVPVQSIATSNALDDNGMFELDFQDARYLPFEGAGAISRWRLALADEFRQFDYDSISDVVMHLRYTARDGGIALGKQAVEDVTRRLGEGGTGLSCMLSVRHDFPDVWQRLRRAKEEVLTVDVPVDGGRFPYFAARNAVTVTGLSVLMPGARPDIGEVGVEFFARPSGRPVSERVRLSGRSRNRITVFDHGDTRISVPVRDPASGQEPDGWRLTIPTSAFHGEHPAGDVILLCTYAVTPRR